ncbi:MAG: addiction module protein [Verrucomicrobiaceae bacterium]|nr:addiction module protein [Verrucomicrobiaceae bacterium]
MTATAESLLHQALKLSEQDRSELVDQLAESIEPEADLSDEEKSTLDRRWDEIVSGKVKCRDAFEVIAEIEARLREKVGTAS